MPIKTQSAKSKGRRLQQVVRDKIYEYFPDLREGDVESTSMGAGGEDVKLSPAARDILPISIECKANKAFAVYKIMEQAQANAGDYEPVGVIKGNRKKPLALVDLDYFLKLHRGRV